MFAILDYWWVEGSIEWWQKQTFTSFSKLANMYHVKESSSGGEDLDEDSEYAGLLDCGDSSTSATSSAAGLLASPSSSTCNGVLTGGLGVGCTAAPTDKISSISSCVIRPTNPHLSSDEWGWWPPHWVSQGWRVTDFHQVHVTIPSRPRLYLPTATSVPLQ